MTTPWLLLLGGCPKPPPVVAPFDWTEPPHVPAPSSGTFAAVAATPTDRGVAEIVGDHRFDASLAGAAAGIGLDLAAGKGGLTIPELREAAWRAGWPYPVTTAQVWIGRAGFPPPEAVGAWVASQSGTLGLVRVRKGLEEAWVGLGGSPRVDLGTFPRQLPVGGTLAVPAVLGGTVLIADPNGTLTEADLATGWSAPTNLAGEWLLEVRDAAGPLASFPVYVGMVPPDLSLLVPTDPPSDAAAAIALADQCLKEVRGAYGLLPFAPDPILDAAARTALADPSVPMPEIARLTGLDAAALWRWECRGSTVESCLDSVVWDVRARPGLLLLDGLRGVVAEVAPSGVHLVYVVGAP